MHYKCHHSPSSGNTGHLYLKNRRGARSNPRYSRGAVSAVPLTLGHYQTSPTVCSAAAGAKRRAAVLYFGVVYLGGCGCFATRVTLRNVAGSRRVVQLIKRGCGSGRRRGRRREHIQAGGVGEGDRQWYGQAGGAGVGVGDVVFMGDGVGVGEDERRGHGQADILSPSQS